MDGDAGEGKAKDRSPRWALMARRFYEQALVDLDSARESVRPRRCHNAVMFAEQAAEKALKAAYWHLLAEEPAWRHEMHPVAEALGERAGGLPDEVLAAAYELDVLSNRLRYPSGNVDEPIPADRVDESDADTAIERAETVMRWAESLLRLPTGKPRRRKS